MNIIAIDSGFGYLKALVNNKMIKFPNIVGNYRPSPNGMIGQEKDLSISVDRLGAWNFGNTATLQSSGGGTRSQSPDRIFTDEFLAGLLLAISEGYSKQTKKMSVDIVTGLPGSDYTQYANKKDKTFQNGFKDFIQGSYCIHRSDYSQQITINSIRCTNQGWGAIWRHLIDEKGNPVRPDIRVNVVDIGNVNVGHYTIENGTVQVSGILNGTLGVVEAEGKRKSEPSGIHSITDSLVADLFNKFGISYTVEKAISIMEDGETMIDGQQQKYQLSDEIKRNFGSSCFRLATQVWKKEELRSLYRLILTGGGANIVKDAFSHIPQVCISDNPQWDTVIGYMRLGKLINRRD